MSVKKRRAFKAVVAVVAVLVLLTVSFGVWSVGLAYKPDAQAQAALISSNGVTVTEEKFGLFFDGEGTDKVIVFYPGARVDYRSYAPLMKMLAENGIDCFAVKMPCNMAFFGMNKALRIMKEYDYEYRYISGHSLGGAMAASYASKHADELDGVILLASYPTSSLDFDNLTVISLYGSEDGVLNFDNLEKGREYMPESYREIVIEGGNHALFGSYGVQSGDGTATITGEEQLIKTVTAVNEVIG